MMDPESAKNPNGPPPEVPVLNPGLVTRLFREERTSWRRHYRKHFKRAARALGLGFVAGFAYFLLRPDQEQKALEFVVRALKDIPVGGSPLVLALTLFYHNVRASAIAVAAGAIPFLYLPILDPVLNGGVLGLLAAVGKHHGLDVPRLIVTQILPHGVFELAAVLYTTSLGLYLSEAMGKKALAAWNRRASLRSGQTPPAPGPDNFLETCPERPGAEAGSVARDIVRSFVLVVLPLLLIAALIEGFITPLLG